jgi:isoleucyl-tRNA synthetase
MDRLFQDLNNISDRKSATSVHLSHFPKSDNGKIDADLERKMQLAQKITSLTLSLRKKEMIRVRQPLQKIMIPILNKNMQQDIEQMSAIILNETNVKEIKYLTEDSDVLTKQIKPNFKTLGPKFGKDMKLISEKIAQFSSEDIRVIEKERKYQLNNNILIDLNDVEITSVDIPGCVVSSNDGVTVALDINISESLNEEGLAREFINRIQNLRKDRAFKVTDKITILIENNEQLSSAIQNNFTYICNETLADKLEFITSSDNEIDEIELVDQITAKVSVKKQ